MNAANQTPKRTATPHAWLWPFGGRCYTLEYQNRQNTAAWHSAWPPRKVMSRRDFWLKKIRVPKKVIKVAEQLDELPELIDEGADPASVDWDEVLEGRRPPPDGFLLRRAFGFWWIELAAVTCSNCENPTLQIYGRCLVCTKPFPIAPKPPAAAPNQSDARDLDRPGEKLLAELEDLLQEMEDDNRTTDDLEGVKKRQITHTDGFKLAQGFATTGAAWKTALLVLAIWVLWIGSFWQGLLVSSLVYVALAALLRQALQEGELNLQQHGQERLRHLIEDISAGREVDSFVLYIRNSIMNGFLLGRDSRFFPTFTSVRRRPFEEVLARDLRPLGDMIGLGMPGEARGAWRLETSNEDWRETAAALIPEAPSVLVVPSLAQGVLWEIDWIIANECLSKCVFVLPPNEDQDLWQSARTAYRDIGIILPCYSPGGLFFGIEANGEPAAVTQLRLRGYARPKQKALLIAYSRVLYRDASLGALTAQ